MTTPLDAEALLAYATVRQWLEHRPLASLRPRDDRAERLGLLAAYCAELELDPDTLVANARASAEVKNLYLKRLVSWAGALPFGERARHDAENTVRGFFMRNGFRVVARPYRDVYRRSGSGEQ